jgi:hypothetical protein
LVQGQRPKWRQPGDWREPSNPTTGLFPCPPISRRIASCAPLSCLARRSGWRPRFTPQPSSPIHSQLRRRAIRSPVRKHSPVVSPPFERWRIDGRAFSCALRPTFSVTASSPAVWASGAFLPPSIKQSLEWSTWPNADIAALGSTEPTSSIGTETRAAIAPEAFGCVPSVRTSTT